MIGFHIWIQERLPEVESFGSKWGDLSAPVQFITFEKGENAYVLRGNLFTEGTTCFVW